MSASTITKDNCKFPIKFYYIIGNIFIFLPKPVCILYTYSIYIFRERKRERRREKEREYREKMLVVQLEGNISSGKSTFLEYLQNQYFLDSRFRVEFVHESLKDWINMDNINLLELYYQTPREYAEIFQMYVFFTMLNNSLKSNFNDNTNLIFIERSLKTCVKCFSRLLEKKQYVRPIFYQTLSNFYEKIQNRIIHPDIIIYFKIDNNDISILQDRILKRDRKAERAISNEYLIDLNNVYNEVINTDYSNIKKYIIPVNMSRKEQVAKYFIPITDNILDMVGYPKNKQKY